MLTGLGGSASQSGVVYKRRRLDSSDAVDTGLPTSGPSLAVSKGIPVITEVSTSFSLSCGTCGSSDHIARDCLQSLARGQVANCYRCGKPGHTGEYCTEGVAKVCLSCGAEDHIARDCSIRGRPELEEKIHCDGVYVEPIGTPTQPVGHHLHQRHHNQTATTSTRRLKVYPVGAPTTEVSAATQ
jgi:hypothetical protein